MTECVHRRQRTRHEFSGHDGRTVVEVFGCEKHRECTLRDVGVVVANLYENFDPGACRHRGDKTRTAEASCCSDGPIEVFACTLYDECAVLGAPGVMHACSRCPRHTSREYPLAVCEGCPDLKSV